ncbi:hypothetical protein QYF61_012972 [Mycteria americana]|uniref:Uncharacterized protein n=1 Tax=Mycteria americana TaxID=33587 RepID=A0AAN7NS93_MYCAM|nr:hypothetical protein QYF61_012972 [Mycteria americana]
MLTGPDHLVVLYVPRGGTQGRSLESLPGLPRPQRGMAMLAPRLQQLLAPTLPLALSQGWLSNCSCLDTGSADPDPTCGPIAQSSFSLSPRRQMPLEKCCRITESYRLEKTFKIIKSNHKPRPPLYHVPKHLIQMSFKYLQGW